MFSSEGRGNPPVRVWGLRGFLARQTLWGILAEYSQTRQAGKYRFFHAKRASFFGFICNGGSRSSSHAMPTA